MFRHPKTFRRQSLAHMIEFDPEIEVVLKIDRHAKNMPTSWCDIEKKHARSWKKYRSQQYRSFDWQVMLANFIRHITSVVCR